MTRALLITNPAAARTEEVAVMAILETLRRGGWNVDLRATGGPGDARRFAAEAATAGHDVVAVFGGDGTTMQAATALVGTGTALGVLPGGTAICGGEPEDPTHPLGGPVVARAPRPSTWDDERADGPHFCRLVRRRARCASNGGDQHLRQALAFRGLLRDHVQADAGIAQRGIFTVDGVEYETRQPRLGRPGRSSHLPASRGIRPDDGVLDVRAAESPGTPPRPGGPREAWGGRPRRYAQGKTITVQTTPPEPVQLDGDVYGVTPFTAEVVPHAIHVVAPRSSR
jgi:hypothetical protein